MAAEPRTGSGRGAAERSDLASRATAPWHHRASSEDPRASVGMAVVVTAFAIALILAMVLIALLYQPAPAVR